MEKRARSTAVTSPNLLDKKSARIIAAAPFLVQSEAVVYSPPSVQPRDEVVATV